MTNKKQESDETEESTPRKRASTMNDTTRVIGGDKGSGGTSKGNATGSFKKNPATGVDNSKSKMKRPTPSTVNSASKQGKSKTKRTPPSKKD